MRKRVLRLILLVGFVLSLCGSTAFAQNALQSESLHTVHYEYYEDGSYCVITVEENTALQEGTRAMKTGTKSKAYYNNNGVLLFTVYVYGTFSYNGTTATATSASYGYSISSTSWSFASGTASCTGATATAICSFRNTQGTLKTISASLTCSPAGVLS